MAAQLERGGQGLGEQPVVVDHHESNAHDTLPVGVRPAPVPGGAGGR
ncbi:hypothetical protein ACFQ0M_28560 [Kitasatospora aburaviensis]